MCHSKFVSRILLLEVVILMMAISHVRMGQADSTTTLFPTHLSHTEWVKFECDGYSTPVTGIIYGPDKPTCCGVPLGGVATGCIDIEVGGVLGFETLFNQFPRQPQLLTPFLGLVVDGQTHVLADQKYLDGGEIEGCVEPNRETEPTKDRDWTTHLITIQGVSGPKRIHYFGHYPVVDIEYELEAPVSVGLRAWSPLVPGDIGASNIPAAVFEVRLRNTGQREQKATLIFSFPGIPRIPILHEGHHSYRREAIEQPVRGISIGAPGQIGYVLGVIDSEGSVRTGADLSTDPGAWAAAAKTLPKGKPNQSGASVALDVTLGAGQSQTVRFVLAWYSPIFIADVDKRYTNFYVARYGDATEVAARMARDHEKLLRRVLAWQEVIYADPDIPGYLQDGLIQTLCMIPETTYWAMAKGPLGDWCYPDGYFAMNESPRGCSHIECIPCTYYGGIPITYFYPQLARTTLRAYTKFQRVDGATPFDLGPCCNSIALMTPSHEWQKALNGMCYVALVDRLWQVTGDRSVLKEFYAGVKKSTQYTYAMSANHGEDAVISVPDDQRAEWWEGFDWYGMTAHAGGLRISNMSMALRMAEAFGDVEFANQCRQWFEQGRASMENKMWNEEVGSYLLYRHDKLDKQDDTIMANQFDGEWNNDFHGLNGIFRKERLDRALETIKKSCLTDYGSVSFANTDLVSLETYGIFPPEIMMLGFTYLYEGDRKTGFQVLRNCLHNLFIKHCHTWDLPNMVSGGATFTDATEEGREGFFTFGEGSGEGQRTYGTDYYQNMMLWAAPAAVAGTDISDPTRSGGLVHRIIEAGRDR